MHYVVLGTLDKQGIVGDDTVVWNNGVYSELGWELMVYRTCLINSIVKGWLEGEYTIVTHRDRQCLYPFAPTVAYEDWQPNGTDTIYDYTTHANCVVHLENLGISELKFPNWAEIKDLALSHKRHYFFPAKPFFCLAVRHRDLGKYRQLPADYWSDLVEHMPEHDLVVFGKQTEYLDASHSNIKHVDLGEWIEAIQHPLCLGCIGTMTGAMAPCHFWCKNRMYLIDNGQETFNELYVGNGKHSSNHPLLFGDVMHFSGAPITRVCYTPMLKEVLEWVNK